MPIVKVLCSDGIGYFLVSKLVSDITVSDSSALQILTCFRGLNVTLAALARPSFTLLGVLYYPLLNSSVLF